LGDILFKMKRKKYSTQEKDLHERNRTRQERKQEKSMERKRQELGLGRKGELKGQVKEL